MSNTKTAPNRARTQVKKGQTSKVEKVTKPETKEVKTPLLNIVIPSADDRIKRMENFQLVTSKYQQLKDKNEELKKFKISSDGTRESLTLSNGAGINFKVTNSFVMEKVTNLLQNELDVLTKESEIEVQQFEV